MWHETENKHNPRILAIFNLYIRARKARIYYIASRPWEWGDNVFRQYGSPGSIFLQADAGMEDTQKIPSVWMDDVGCWKSYANQWFFRICNWQHGRPCHPIPFSTIRNHRCCHNKLQHSLFCPFGQEQEKGTLYQFGMQNAGSPLGEGRDGIHAGDVGRNQFLAP